MAYERLDLQYGDSLNADVFKHIEDGITALDVVLDAKVEEVEKIHYSNNRFDKTKYPLVQRFFLYNNTSTDNVGLKFGINTTSTGGAGSGWTNIPVEPGKTYTMGVRDLLTLSDLDNAIYGVFTNLFFTDSAGYVVTCVPCQTKTPLTYWNKINDSTSTEWHTATAYNTSKIICNANGKGSNTYHGMFTDAITFTVIDPAITHVHVQIGCASWGSYQVKTEFVNRGALTEEEATRLQNSFQINEGTVLHDYDEFDEYPYIEYIPTSNLSKLEDTVNAAFSVKEIPSTNLLNPGWVSNHTFIRNYTNKGKIVTASDEKYALLQIPVEVGDYTLSSPLVEIEGTEFGYFNNVIFTTEDGTVVTAKYPFKTEENIPSDYDLAKVIVTGAKSNRLVMQIFDPTIKYAHIALRSKTSSDFGMWNDFSNEEGMDDEDLYNLVYGMQLNKGTKALAYEAFDHITKISLVTSDRIEGLDTFQNEMIGKIDEAIAKMSFTDKKMTVFVDENDMYVRAKEYTADDDFVWHMRKVRLKDNRYFNLETMYTCPKVVPDELMTANLKVWKQAYDDIGPSSFNGTYIAGNHGFNCVDRITVTGHDKTDADIGSIWTDYRGKTFVLVYIYDADSLGFIQFNDKMMSDGVMNYASPGVGTVMTHQSGATNTGSVTIEEVKATQAWKSWNHYTLRLFVDDVEYDLAAGQMIAGDRIEFVTEYNVIYIPAMLTYLMENVGNNNSDSQNSDEITDHYAKIAIRYSFNKNGSLSEYNSYYINKELKIGYIGLVQSISLKSGDKMPYTYLPDTDYEVLTLHDGSVTQRFSKSLWNDANKVPYRYYQFTDETAVKGVCLTYDRSIGWGNNEKRLQHIDDAGMFYTSTKMYPSFISGGYLYPGDFFDGMAARIPLYKVDEDITSIGWYWSNEDIIMMIDCHQTVNKEILLPNYMNHLRIEKLDVTDSVNMEQTYIHNGKIRFQCTDYGYAVLRLYK